MFSNKNKLIAAFTLIELAIVLAVIGLIAGGVLSGKALIRQSKINSIMIDAQRYISAVGQFQQKYNTLPGDMANATSFWGALGTCPPSSPSAVPGTTTCNGDGNGKIGLFSAGNATPNEEISYFWQHLADAGMIQGAYSGSGDGATLYGQGAGINVPVTRLGDVGFSVEYVGYQSSGTNNFYGGQYGNLFWVGFSPQLGSNGLTNNVFLTTTEASGFDLKFDDGLPGTGSVQVRNTSDNSCSSSATAYNTGSPSGFKCYLMLLTGF